MGRSQSTTSPFRSGAFRVYWFGGLCSNSGTWLHAVTSSVLMFTLTGSSFMVGVLNFANFVPILLLSLVGGVVSDRIERRRLVVIFSASSAIVSLLLTLLAYAGRVTPMALIVVSFLLGSGYAFAKPALSAMLPALVADDQLSHATAVNTLQFTLGQVTGSTLATLILAISEPWVAFGTNTLTYLAPITAMVLLRGVVVQERGSKKASGWASLREGFAFIAGGSGLLPITIAIVFTNGIVECLRTLAPALAEHGLELAAKDAGLLIGAIGVGSAIGASVFGRLSARLDRRRLIQLGFLLQMAGALGSAWAATLVQSLAAAVLIGTGFATIIPLLSAVMQERSPDALRGRVMAAFAMAHLGLRPLSALIAGGLASLMGPRITLSVFVLSALAGLVTLRGGRSVLAEPGPRTEEVQDPARSVTSTVADAAAAGGRE
jgi:MFS family permease